MVLKIKYKPWFKIGIIDSGYIWWQQRISNEIRFDKQKPRNPRSQVCIWGYSSPWGRSWRSRPRLRGSSPCCDSHLRSLRRGRLTVEWEISTAMPGRTATLSEGPLWFGQIRSDPKDFFLKCPAHSSDNGTQLLRMSLDFTWILSLLSPFNVPIQFSYSRRSEDLTWSNLSSHLLTTPPITQYLSCPSQFPSLQTFRYSQLTTLCQSHSFTHTSWYIRSPPTS